MPSVNSQKTPKQKVNTTSYLKRNPRFNAALLSLLVVAFSVGGYFVYSSFAYEGPTDFNDKADTEAQVKALTASVKLRSSKYAYSKKQHASDETKNKDTVAHVAAQRRLAMRKLMLTKPEAASAYVLPDEAKNDLPDDTKNSVESRVSLEGTWTTSMDERFDPKTGKITSAKPIYSIATKDSSLNVVVAKVPDNVRHLDTVKLSGVTIDGMIAVSKDGLANKQLSEQTNQKIAKLPLAAKLIGVEPVRAAVTTTPITPYNPPATGTKQVAVYMVNFSNDKATPSLQDDTGTVASMSTDILQKFLTTDANSVSKYYANQSSNLFTPVFTVHNWYTSSANNNVDCTNYAEGLLTDILLASIGNAIDARDKTAVPNTRIFLFNRLNCTGDSTLGAGATGELPVPTAGSIPSIRFVQTGATKQWFTSAIAHELGHTLGLLHAMKDTPNCTGTCQTAYPQTYLDHEYGDVYDVMGSGIIGESAYFNAYHQFQLGWLKWNTSTGLGPIHNYNFIYATLPTNTTTNVSYSIFPIETAITASNSPRAVAIPLEKNTNDSFNYYFIEYRNKIAGPDVFDGFTRSYGNTFDAAKNPKPGVLIYKAKIPSSDGTDFTTLLLNPIYGGHDFSQGHILKKGQVFIDTSNNIKISDISTATDKATIKIESTGDTIPPSVPTNITATPLPRAVEVGWTNPKDNDLYFYSIFIKESPAGKWVCTDLVYGSGNINKSQPLCTNYVMTPGRKYYVTMKAYDRWNNASPETSPVEFTAANVPTVNPAPAEYSGRYPGFTNTEVDQPSFTLSWSAISGATSYVLRRNDGKVFNTSKTTYTDSNVTPYVYYRYSVQPKFSSSAILYPTVFNTGMCYWKASVYKWRCSAASVNNKYHANWATSSDTSGAFSWF